MLRKAVARCLQLHAPSYGTARKAVAEGPELAHFLRSSAAAAAERPSASRPPPLDGDAPQPSVSPHCVSGGEHEIDAAPRYAGTFYVETYGCQMNESDTEIAASILLGHGYTRAASLDAASVVLLNTCAVRENAEKKIWNRLAELRAMRRASRHTPSSPSQRLVIGVLGCMAERLKDSLLKGVPGTSDRHADLVVGPDSYRDLPRILSIARGVDGSSGAAMNVQLSLEETYADVAPVREADAKSAFISVMVRGRRCGALPAASSVSHH